MSVSCRHSCFRTENSKQSPYLRSRRPSLKCSMSITMSNGSMESNSLSTIKTHVDHLLRILDRDIYRSSHFHSTISRITSLSDHRRKASGERYSAQIHVEKKSQLILSAIWSWGQKKKYVTASFPSKGFRYCKTEEKPRFQTWNEIEFQIRRGCLDDDEQAELWDCLFLTRAEISELLSCVSNRANHAFIFPMLATAAYPGARQSELMRAQIRDFDFAVKWTPIFGPQTG